MNIHPSKYIRFAFLAIFYLFIIIWIGNYWLLIGLAVLFDAYVSEKVNWTFWKKRNGKNSTFIEWLDALIFAVIAVTLIHIFLFQNYRIPTPSMEKSLLVGDHLFVSKLAFGPRMPNTPIAFPFTQHTMPLTKGKSWLDIVHWPYKRLIGFGQVKNNDPIVFNFPAGDTVVVEDQTPSYYDILRRTEQDFKDRDYYNSRALKNDTYYANLARKEIKDRFHIIYRPVDRRDNFVKRCIGIPGDTILIKGGSVFVNDKLLPESNSQQTNYTISTNGTTFNPKALQRLGISIADQQQITGGYILPLTKENSEKIAKFTNVTSINLTKEIDASYFPYSKTFKWELDNFGPIWIPAKGTTTKIDTSNICLYERIIDVYENNDLRIEGDKIIINDIQTDSYTFLMDYYWMMGDNRHNSADSRYWGFVPEDHVIGKPKFIWLSLDKEAKGLKKIRFGRLFMKVK